jgi:hypothetical protein
VRVHACKHFSCSHIYCCFKDKEITSSTVAVFLKSGGVDLVGYWVGAYNHFNCWLFHVYDCFGAENYLWLGGVTLNRA